jgi:hypothetical protein
LDGWGAAGADPLVEEARTAVSASRFSAIVGVSGG